MESVPVKSDPERPGHKRNRSAALKSIIMPKSRTPSPTKPSPLKTRPKGRELGFPPSNYATNGAGFLPPVHPHAGQPVLGEIQNRQPVSASPKKTTTGKDILRPRESGNDTSSSPSKRVRDYNAQPRDKENTTPPSTAMSDEYTPIWAQFTSQSFESSNKSAEAIDPSKRTDGSRVTSDPSARAFARSNESSDTTRFNDYRTRPSQSDNINNAHQQRGKTSTSSVASYRNSKVMAAVAVLNGKTQDPSSQSPVDAKELEAAFEAVLASRNVPENMRENMRSLDPIIKADFIRHTHADTPKAEKEGSSKSSLWGTLTRGRAKSTAEERNLDDTAHSSSPSKRSRSRGRTFTLSKGERSPTKRGRSNSRPRSLMLLKNFSSSSVHSLGVDGTAESKNQSSTSARFEEVIDPLRRPDDFVDYLHENPKPQNVEVGKLHKLRLLLRNESVSWVDTFILKGGMKELLGLLTRIRQMEWREEHEDLLLHEVLLCLKGLCTTQLALDKLSEVSSTLFPDLLAMLFDEERRGPSEFNTRGVVINLIYTHLATATSEQMVERARSVLSYLSNPAPPEEARPIGFILQMHQHRPYQVWCKEISNVTKEVFWIFLHHHNVISIPPVGEAPESATFTKRHFPKGRPPVPVASWVGGVEWECTNYLAAHLDLMNGLLASLPTRADRNSLREELRVSGFEKLMGGSLRLCKEKFYGAVHDCLRTWILAAIEDDWESKDVRMGPPPEESKSPTKSPKKGGNAPPKLELPKLDLGVEKTSKLDEDDDCDVVALA